MSSHDQRRWAPPVLRVAGEDDGEVYVVGVQDATASASWSLLFMECYNAEDEQEVALGMDTYCLVVDPGHATHYGGVRECVVTDTHLRLVLTDDSAHALGMPGETHFDLALPQGQRELLRRGLRRVLTSGRPDAVPRRLEM